jgi:hypothetical protein
LAGVDQFSIIEAGEAQRARFVQKQFGSTFPGVVQ